MTPILPPHPQRGGQPIHRTTHDLPTVGRPLSTQRQPERDNLDYPIDRVQETCKDTTHYRPHKQWVAWRGRHKTQLGTLNKGQQMNTLYLLIACDLGFALFVWWIYRDHNRKMDALYKKYDKDYSDRDRRIEGTDKN